MAWVWSLASPKTHAKPSHSAKGSPSPRRAEAGATACQDDRPPHFHDNVGDTATSTNDAITRNFPPLTLRMDLLRQSADGTRVRTIESTTLLEGGKKRDTKGKEVRDGAGTREEMSSTAYWALHKRPHSLGEQWEVRLHIKPTALFPWQHHHGNAFPAAAKSQTRLLCDQGILCKAWTRTTLAWEKSVGHDRSF